MTDIATQSDERPKDEKEQVIFDDSLDSYK